MSHEELAELGLLGHVGAAATADHPNEFREARDSFLDNECH